MALGTRCPGCGHENREGRRFCSECGAPFAPACASCGAQNEVGEKFCGACGSPLSLEPQAEPAPVAPLPSVPPALASGRYEIERFLGEGAKKRVYLARDTRLRREVALAIVKTEGLDEGGRVRVRREAEAMGQLGDHPHIVTIFDVAEERGQIYIVSQYMAAGDLEGRLREAEGHRLARDETLRIAEQLCRALEHAHARGVIHRDLKPANVYLDLDGTAKLGDFGLAVSLDRSRLTQEGMMVGTATYMPPEQALGRSADARSDLYALGATLYEMVTGRPPFLGDDAVSIISQHLNTPPVAPAWHSPEIPRRLDALILRLLEKDPDERPASARAVAEELQRIGDPEEATAEERVHERAEVRQAAWGRFVGRRTELEQLKAALAGAFSGRGGVLMVVGEPGIGKTRLAEEFAVYAKLRGAEVVVGRCYEGGIALPYLPFIEAFRQHIRARADEELRAELGLGAPEVATLVSEVRQRLPDVPESAPLEGEAERLRLFESVATFVRNIAAERPLVLVLDDLHWADKPTLLLMQHLARGTRNDRVLVVGTYRDVELERTHPLAEVVASLRRERLYERVLLRGLPLGEVQALINAIGEQEAPEPFVQAIYRETEGNPFFIEEVLRHLAETGAISRGEGGWVGDASLIEESIPEGVREVIGRRLSRLSDACNGMLTIASAMPGGFPFDVVVRVSAESEDRLLDLVDEALRARVIVERKELGGGSYEFTHALIRQTLYGEVNTPRRVRLHRQIGEALEGLYGANPEPHLSELAHHFFQAAVGGDVSKAVDYSVRAGQRAMNLVAYEEAAEHYGRALQALELGERPDPQTLCEVRLALGEAQLRGGERERAHEAFAAAADRAREIGAPELLARAALGYGGGFGVAEMGTVDESVVSLLEEALAALAPDDSPLRATLLATLANQLYFSEEDYERRLALAEEAVGVARRVEDKRALIQTLYAHAMVLNPRSSTFERVLEVCDELVRVAEELDDRERLAFGYGFRIAAHLALGQVAEFEADLERHERLVEEIRQPLYAWLSVTHRAMWALLNGRFEEARGLIDEALRIGEPVEGPNAVTVFGAQNYQLRRETGTGLEELEPALRQFVEQYPALPAWRCGLAVLYADLDREEDARREFEWIARDDFGGLPRDGNWLASIALLAEACVYLHDTARAELLYPLLRPHAELNLIVGPGAVCSGSIGRHLGGLAATMSRWAEAVGHFERALEMNTRIRARPYLARTQVAYARMLLDRREPGDSERAVRLVNEALDTAQELGMKELTEKALALKFQAQGVDSGEIRSSIYAVASIVDRRRPDLTPHAAPDGTVTLMFSDMAGFSAMTERLGDRRAHEVVQSHNRIVREQLAAHDGYEVELQGDGFLLAFGSARKAALCAIGIQRALAAHNEAGGDPPIRVRIGLHTGEAIKDADKFFGKTVIQAYRIADHARAGEILVSSLFKQLVESAGDLRFEAARQVELKGLSGTHQLYAVAWS